MYYNNKVIKLLYHLMNITVQI